MSAVASSHIHHRVCRPSPRSAVRASFGRAPERRSARAVHGRPPAQLDFGEAMPPAGACCIAVPLPILRDPPMSRLSFRLRFGSSSSRLLVLLAAVSFSETALADPPSASTPIVSAPPPAPDAAVAAPAPGAVVAAPAPAPAVVVEAPAPVLGAVAAAPIVTEPPVDTRTAGWYDDIFFLREPTDDFRLYIQGRANIDGYVPFGPGVADLAPGNALKSTVFLRRVRPEVAGEFLHVLQFKIEGDWGPSTSDNTNGQAAALNCTVDAKTGTQTCSPRSSAIEAPTARPSALDVYINWTALKYLNFEVGQFKVPFTLENRSSENYTPFLEASLPVRD